MIETTSDPSKNQQKTPLQGLKLDEKTTKFLKSYIDEAIYEQFEPVQRVFKLKEEALFSALETLQNAIKIMQKETNYKLGAINQKANKQNQFQTSDITEAITVANEIRKKNGLPLIEVPPEQLAS